MSMTDTMKGSDWFAVALLSLVLGAVLCLPTALGSSGGDSAADEAGGAAGAPLGQIEHMPLVGSGSGVAGDGGSIGLYDDSEGVAATVNGVPLGESAVRAYMGSYREAAPSLGLSDGTLRGQAVQYLTELELLRQAAAGEGVPAVTGSDVRRVADAVAEGFADHDAYLAYLKGQGMGELMFEVACERDLLREGLIEAVAGGVAAPDEDVLLFVDPAAEANLRAAEARAGQDEADRARARAAAVRDGLAELDAADVSAAHAYLDRQARVEAFESWFDEYAATADVEVAQ